MSPQRSTNPNAILALLATVVFAAVVNGTIVNIALPYIGRDFGVSEGTYGWIATGYALSFGIFNAINGRLADLLGMKRLYIFGLVMLGGGALAVALAPTVEAAIALRILQGAGAAALPVLQSSIIARLVGPEKRGAAMGIIMASVGVAASIGPFLGGVLVQLVGWRFCLAFASVVLLAIPVAWKLLPASLNEKQSTHFDAVGATLMAVAVGVGMYGFEVLETNGLGIGFLGTVGVAGLLSAAFWAWVNRAEQPFAHPDLFRNTKFLATSAIAFLSNGTRFGTIVLIPIVLTEVHRLPPVYIGFVLAPGAVAIALLSRRAGKVADRLGPRGPVAVGTVFILAGNLVAAAYAGDSAVGVAIGMLLYGIGFANIQTPLVATVSQIVPKSMTGVGMGIFMMIFFVGGAFGTALSVTTVELQSVHAASWLGLSLGEGARYSNGILALNGLALLGIALVRLLPRGRLADLPQGAKASTV